MVHQINNPDSGQKIGLKEMMNHVETHNTNFQIKFDTTMLKSSFGDYGSAYIFFERIVVVGA